jgi:hypothetical protein
MTRKQISATGINTALDLLDFINTLEKGYLMAYAIENKNGDPIQIATVEETLTDGSIVVNLVVS